jgi:predicted nucleic acid-binding protein
MGSAVMISVKGILIPVNWDKKGNVVSVAIATDDESEYLIEDQELAEKLKSRLRQVVQVRGVVEKAQGKNIIKIKQWRCQNA